MHRLLCGRFVRQDSTLWDDLHDGVLTTGIANAALGCATTWPTARTIAHAGCMFSFQQRRACIM